MNMPTPENLTDPALIGQMRAILEPLARYHQHRVEGMERVPTEGPVILVVNHSMATYDGFLLSLAIHDAIGRIPAGLGDDLIFKIPKLGKWAHRLGLRPANPRTGRRLLAEGHMVGLAPGGMREALRPSSERAQVRWEKRRGFIRLALHTGAPIVLAACPRADDLYTVYKNPLTKLAYRHLKVPLPIIRGLGPTLLPRPIELVHYVAEPLYPPPHEPRNQEAQVDALHAQVVERMNGLMRGVCNDG